MKKFILLLILLPIITLAQIPQTMNYQGRLEDNSGNPVSDGNYTIVFSIYDAATNGNSLWTETRTVTTEDGFFNLTLGESTAININSNQQIWLNISIGGNDLTPRTKLSGSLSSLSSKSIENTTTAGNSVVSSINSSTGGVDASKIADGSVSNTEFQLLDGASSNIQTQLDSKQSTLPSQGGNSGKFLSTDGTNLSWETTGGGGGSSLPEVIELSLGSLITLTSSTYVNITDSQPTLAADAVYLVKGLIGAERKGGSSNINIDFDYSGTASLVLIEVRDRNSNTSGLLENYAIIGSITEHVLNGVIRTTTSGTLTVKSAKYAAGNTDSDITTATKIILIRVK